MSPINKTHRHYLSTPTATSKSSDGQQLVVNKHCSLLRLPNTDADWLRRHQSANHRQFSDRCAVRAPHENSSGRFLASLVGFQFQ